MIEANSPTAKFIQALALLEFLADPFDYQRFYDVRKTIARYVAQNSDEYRRVLDRFLELTGKKDPSTQQIIGYRTRIIHIGDRLDQVVPRASDRLALFEEPDGYIRPVIDHMIKYSWCSFEDYLQVRGEMRPFET
jgi:hypothetical protein